jgi:hypothetical protein
MASNLKLENFSDRELLHILNDLSDGMGDWVDVEVMATRLGLQKNGMSDEQYALHARRCLSTRLGWIARLSGAVEREVAPGIKNREMPPRWRLTEVGTQVVTAKLSLDMSNRLEAALSDYATLIALEKLSRRFITANQGAANLMRREWTYGTHRKRRG